MRSFLLAFIYLFCLTACVNYAGIHSNAKPLYNNMLTTSQVAENNSRKFENAYCCDWWKRYNDPQLNQLVDIALQDSPSLDIAKNRVLEAQHIAEMTGSALWPTLDASGTIAREHLTQNTFFPPPFGNNNYTETNVGLNFNYEFDFWGKNRQALEAAISRARAARADYLASRLILTTAITNDYFQLQSYQAALKIADDYLQQEREIFNIVQARARHGVESEIPVSSADTIVQFARIVVDNVKKQIEITRHQIAALTAQDPMLVAIQTRPFTYKKKFVALPANIPINLLGQRPDIVAARMRVEAAAHQVNVAKARFYPNINLNAFFTMQSFTLSKTFMWSSRDYLVGTAIDLPLFDAGLRRANLGEKYAEYDMAVSNYNKTLLTGLNQVADQLTNVRSFSSQVAAANLAVKVTQSNYKLARSRYNNGIADYTSVLQSKNTLLLQKLQVLELQTFQLKASVALIKALGGSYITSEA